MPKHQMRYKTGDRVRYQLQGYGDNSWVWGTITEVLDELLTPQYEVKKDGQTHSVSVNESNLTDQPLQDVYLLHDVYTFEEWFKDFEKDTRAGDDSSFDNTMRRCEKTMADHIETIRPQENPGITAYVNEKKRMIDELKSVYNKRVNDAERSYELKNNLKDAYYAWGRLFIGENISSYQSKIFLEEAQKLNLQELKKKIDDADIVSLREEDYYSEVFTKYPEKFSEYVQTTLTKVINNNVDRAYAEKAKGASSAGAANEAAETADNLCKGSLLLLPGNAALEKLQKQVQTTLTKMQGEADAKLYSGSFHKENAGKVVFSKSPVVAGQENPADITSSFVAGDAIYATAYFKGTVKEVAQSGGFPVNIEVGIFLNDNSENLYSHSAAALYSFQLDHTKTGETTCLELDIVPDMKLIRMPKAGEIFAKALGSCSPRPHEITLVVYGAEGYSSLEIARGHFEIDCSEGQESLLEMAPKFKEAANAKVSFPAPVQKDEQLESEMCTALGNKFADWRPGTPLKAVITDKDWKLVRHVETGLLLMRTIYGAVAIKHDSGQCKFYSVRFAQDHDGSSFMPVRVDAYDDGKEIAAENVV